MLQSLYGFTPFVCDKREDTKQKILVRPVPFSPCTVLTISE